MCGLFGIINKNKGKVNQEDLLTVDEVLSHRGPDDKGIYTDKNIGLVHRRLAIFDTTTQGGQPFRKWDKVIAFNGAIYNFLELKSTLQKKGYEFSTHTDTEVLLASYDSWGEKCVEYFNGQWSFAIYDELKQTIFCSRDRYGIKPFYYTDIGHQFCFASEIKAFTKIKGWKARLNRTRAYEYLIYQMHDQTRDTFFEGVSSLRAGHNLIIDLANNQERIEQYYDLSAIQLSSIDEQSAIQEFNRLFEQSISLRLRADVDIGMALSGGLDSSSIVLTVSRLKPNFKGKTFSIVYDEKGLSEGEYVNAVLDKINIESKQLTPSYEYFKKHRQQILWHQEEPYNGMSVEAQYAMFEQVKHEGVTVMLDGQGADEILAGYEKFYWGLMKANTKNPFKVLGIVKDILQKHDFDYGKSCSAFQAYLSKSKNNIGTDWLRISPDTERLFRRGKEDSVLEMSKNLLSGLGLPALLRYEDKNAMAHGIESRVPFLDHELVEYCLSLPDHLKIKNGIRKWVLRESRKEVLPTKIYKRYDKLGFVTPEQKWLIDERQHLVNDIRANHRLRDIVDMSYVERMSDNKLIWRVYLLGEWMKLFDVYLASDNELV